MALKTADIDMIHGPLVKKMILFTIPIALSSMLQQLFNATDTAVVGFFNDANALAAVGTNTEIVALIVTIATGIAIGANLLVSNKIGSNSRDGIPAAVQTAMLLAIIIGLAGLGIGQLGARPLLKLIDTPTTILGSAEAYLRIYLIGFPFLVLYNFGSAILRARGDSRFPFIALVISGIINIGLNLFFVIIFHLGVTGVAISTVISTVVSTIIVLARMSKTPEFQFKLSKLHFTPGLTRKILKIGVPAAVQGAVFCIANIFIQESINFFGETAIAGSTIAMNLEYFTYYIIAAFGQTATTFTGQNYAAGKNDRCKKVLTQCLILSIIFCAIPTYALIIFRSLIARLFSTDSAVIAYACERMMCILVLQPVCSFFEIPSASMRGIGHSLYPAIATMICSCGLRVVWIFTVFVKCHSLPALYYVFPVS